MLEKQPNYNYLQQLNEHNLKDIHFVESRNSNRTNDNWFTLIGLSLSIFQRYTNDVRLYIPRNTVDWIIVGSFLTGLFLSWGLMLYTVRTIRRKYPDATESFKRFVLTSSICLVVFFFLNISTVAIANYYKPSESLALNSRNISQYLAKIVLGVWMIVGMYEAIYQQFLLKETQRQKNELLRMQMQQQIENLKGKVNPHFLFNSLNTLSSLIYTDTEKAEQFVEELSAVYRYLLRNNENDLATLKEEIDFINSYLILIKIRFSDAVVTTIDVDETLQKHKLPAISLQLLVENAIKHNVVSKEAPLHISITTKQGKLVVKNNLQKKVQTVGSEKMGLNYIITKYAMVNTKGVEINDEQNEFVVKLPLIKPDLVESHWMETKTRVSVHE